MRGAVLDGLFPINPALGGQRQQGALALADSAHYVIGRKSHLLPDRRST